ncbi:MAG: hypothetical protein JWO31_1680, partial [Phycisphaerales bacterium]|nr:hypothetical protein [Phycisphaerales bacterium]
MFRRRPPPALADASPAVALARPTLPERWWGKLLLVALGAVLLTLAFAPFYQFWAAWVGLV